MRSRKLLAGSHASDAQLAAIRHHYQLDQPLPKQYATYLDNLLHGDLGSSMHTQRSVTDDLLQFLPATIELATAALLFAIVLGVLMGTVAAVRRNSWLSSSGPGAGWAGHAQFLARTAGAMVVLLHSWLVPFRWATGSQRAAAAAPHRTLHGGQRAGLAS